MGDSFHGRFACVDPSFLAAARRPSGSVEGIRGRRWEMTAFARVRSQGVVSTPPALPAQAHPGPPQHQAAAGPSREPPFLFVNPVITSKFFPARAYHRRPRYNEDGLFFTQGDKGSLARGIVLL